MSTHPLGCHNPRVPDRIVFERVIAALAEQVHGPAVQAYDRMIGLRLHELSVDGCITKAPCGGERAGRSPVDRGKQGLKRSVATEARRVPIGLVPAGANRHDSPLLVPTLEAAKKQFGVVPEQVDVNVERGYDSDKTRAALGEPGFTSALWTSAATCPPQSSRSACSSAARPRSAAGTDGPPPGDSSDAC